MAILRVISSGSIGNSYLLKSNNQMLLIELGVKWDIILKALDYKISNVCAALVSHLHLDHAKSIPQALQYRIPVFSNDEVADKYKGVIALQTHKKYRVGGFIIQAIKVEHSCLNYAYVIDNEHTGRSLFITDCVNFPYRVKNVRHLLVEANYSEDIIVDNLCKGYDIRSKNQYHMEINDTIECIKNNYSPDLNTICLIHLSDVQSNEEDFQKRVYEEVGMMPFILTHDQSIVLTKEEF